MRVAAAALLLGLSLSAGAGAQPAPAPRQAVTPHPELLSDAELDARVAFLEQRLDASRRYATWWQWGWTGVWSMGVVVGSLEAGLADDDDDLVTGLTTAAKAVIGTTRLVGWPHPGRLGADPLRAVAGDDRAARLERLALGEDLLLENVRRAGLPRRWWPHVANVGLNLAASAFIAGFGEAEDAAVSFALGTAFGEAQIWSGPARYRNDLEDYQVRFGRRGRPSVRWGLAPVAGGVGLRLAF